MELKKDQYEQIAECFPKQRKATKISNWDIERGAVRNGKRVQMEEPAQRIQRLARDLCPDKSLDEKSVLANAFLCLQQLGIIQIQGNVVSLDSTCIKVHPDGMGALKKADASRRKDTRRVEYQTS